MAQDKLILYQEDSGHQPTPAYVPLKHATLCPVSNINSAEMSNLPAEIQNRGIDSGAVVLVHTADDRVLLTKRASSLSVFPSLWVPPGGHIEESETVFEAGFRELAEETGLHLSREDCDSHVLALWESVYPALLARGLPTRHHIVVYLYTKVHVPHTELIPMVTMDATEVEAAAWIPRPVIEAIVHGQTPEDAVLPDRFKATVFDDRKRQVETELDATLLLQTIPQTGDDVERISMGTKFALSEFLNLTSKK
ncbi:PREDICTED: nucleoside diphosphate-linked moiety X motif 17-like [Priapulus caudatus]|uniref:m7GpppN-mRNA hydrolase NUDT17 n=1 Tax=Priapulus caudatus TaxID=37621 RepID=A0ABM1DVT4_PRICU|nr:PREDICTED: nucleoside diphosphate-linked moiety X motif 17-like [Priapulus caudatus]